MEPAHLQTLPVYYLALNGSNSLYYFIYLREQLMEQLCKITSPVKLLPVIITGSFSEFCSWVSVIGKFPSSFTGCGLNDSPVGLAAYILEKFSSWTDMEFQNLEDGGLER